MWLLGRVDDVMLVSGHNISTAEVESALVDHHAVAEAAVVGVHDPTTGQAISAFVVLKNDHEPSKALEKELRIHVGNLIGAIARPKSILFTDDLPKTRSGKVLRRSIQALAEGRDPGDLTTLDDPAGIEQIRQSIEQALQVERPATCVARQRHADDVGAHDARHRRQVRPDRGDDRDAVARVERAAAEGRALGAFARHRRGVRDADPRALTGEVLCRLLDERLVAAVLVT